MSPATLGGNVAEKAVVALCKDLEEGGEGRRPNPDWDLGVMTAFTPSDDNWGDEMRVAECIEGIFETIDEEDADE